MADYDQANTPKGHIGIREVARIARVSPATVSRTLAGRSVDPAMRRRVEEAVVATGYRPNMAARRLRSRDTGTVGLVVADIRNPFFTAVARAVEEVAYARGLRVILCNTDEDPDREALYLRLMEEERVTGVILSPARDRVETAHGGPPLVPVVLIDRCPPGAAQDAVVLDNREAAALLVQHLKEQGCRRIAGLFGADSVTGRERRTGVLEQAAALGIEALAELVPHGAAAEESVARFLALSDPPDALIASNGVLLLSVIRALDGAGVDARRSPLLAGFDNEPWTEVVHGGITLIEQPVEQIGAQAMAMLLGRLEQPDAPLRKLLLRGRLLVRASTTGAFNPQRDLVRRQASN